jgi:hypothetical protein
MTWVLNPSSRVPLRHVCSRYSRISTDAGALPATGASGLSHQACVHVRKSPSLGSFSDNNALLSEQRPSLGLAQVNASSGDKCAWAEAD